MNFSRLAVAGTKHTARAASSIRASQYRAVAQRFASTDANQTAAASAATPAKKGLRLRTKFLLTLTVLGAGVGGVVKHAFDDEGFRELLEDNVPHFAHSMEKLEMIKDNEDVQKVAAGASVASAKAVELSKAAYRNASDLINGTTTPAPEKSSEAVGAKGATDLAKKVQELEQPKPAAPAARPDYVPSVTPAPVFLSGAAPGSNPRTKEAAAEKKQPKATEKKVEEKKEEVPAPAQPPKKLITIAPIESEEPVMADLNATLKQLVTILNDSGIPEQGHQVFEKATEELKHLNERVEALKVEGEAQAATVMAELTAKYDKLAHQMESDHQGEKSQLRKELQEAFAEEMKEAIARELRIQQDILREEQQQELLKYATEMQRRWVREVKVRVENERGGRLARLDQINVKLRSLERQGHDNAEFLDQSARTHQLWCGVKALEKAYEAGERRPFDLELTRLRRLAESDKDAELLTVVLATIPESVATEGVDSVPELMDRFEYVADRVREASLVPENGGVFAHGMSYLLSKMMFKKHGLVPGNDVESILARTEYYLLESDLEQAVREMNQLKGWSKRLAKDWIAAARRRVEVGQAID
ncbi:Formation of crista junctions protein 1, partial [Lunasporangiospora selenospora]